MHPNRVLKANFWKSLIAVVAGNVLYLLVFSLLPEPARHRPFKLDLGLAVDLWFCLFFYGLIELFLRLRHKPSRSS
jgi:lipopolysaccharide export LptBFGC system permease protein LptF